MRTTLSVVPEALRPAFCAQLLRCSLLTRGMSPEERAQGAVLARHCHQCIYCPERTLPGAARSRCLRPAAAAGQLPRRPRLPLTFADACPALAKCSTALSSQAHTDELLAEVLPEQRQERLPRDVALAPLGAPEATLPVAVALALGLVLQGHALGPADQELPEDAAPVGAEPQPALVLWQRKLAGCPRPAHGAEPDFIYFASRGSRATTFAERLASVQLVHDLAPDATLERSYEQTDVCPPHQALASDVGVKLAELPAIGTILGDEHTGQAQQGACEHCLASAPHSRHPGARPWERRQARGAEAARPPPTPA
mmetsp:Transcript_81920/g.227117  ORF Transcript_81920/g.227117 Transcript_81920/m.227117 type:complete len:312 (+) Transcript_81920:369-1304(+)